MIRQKLEDGHYPNCKRLTSGAWPAIREIETGDLRVDPGLSAVDFFILSSTSEIPRILDLCLFFNRCVWLCGSTQAWLGAGRKPPPHRGNENQING
jgi:hypothetical protein